MGVEAFVIGLSQISSFFSNREVDITNNRRHSVTTNCLVQALSQVYIKRKFVVIECPCYFLIILFHYVTLFHLFFMRTSKSVDPCIMLPGSKCAS